jgi:hypothetical protein
VRERLLEWADGRGGAARGEGVLSMRRDGKGLGSADVRWVSVAESMAVVGSVGPVRAVAGSLRGDSLLLDLRRSDVAVAGPLRGAGIEDPPLLRFLLEPWRFGAPGFRGALERAGVEPDGDGWRLHGALDDGAGGEGRFVLRLGEHAEPVALHVRFGPEAGDTVQVRYGAPRRQASGRIPRWVEWSWGPSRARLDIERHVAWTGATAPRTGLRPDPGDTLLALDGPRGRALLRDLLGVGEGSVER